MKPKIIVQQGSVHVNSVKVLLATDSVIWLSADMRAKRAEIGGVGSIGGDGLGVSLCVGECTTGMEPRARGSEERSTEIGLSGLPSGWVVIASSGRYIVSIVFMWQGLNTLGIDGWDDNLT